MHTVSRPSDATTAHSQIRDELRESESAVMMYRPIKTINWGLRLQVEFTRMADNFLARPYVALGANTNHSDGDDQRCMFTAEAALPLIFPIEAVQGFPLPVIQLCRFDGIVGFAVGWSLGLIGNDSGRTLWHRSGTRSEAFSISRLGGSRWCLRRTRCAMGFECQSGKGFRDQRRAESSESSVGMIEEAGGERVGKPQRGLFR
jgi:hypothetical protein